MKILITSDNHLGYREKDPVLWSDSYRTFDEVLRIAQEEDVDVILQGGDLFHENKPSVECAKRTVELLRKYCVGSRKSDIRSNHPLNVQDEGINVSIPVVIIHGNHDDPSSTRMVSPIDVLQGSGLVNYVGKSGNVEKIDVHPLQLEKEYRVAIYGLGHIKDRRLYKTFCDGGVTFHKPPDYRSWFNILVVHQNRVPREKNYLPERFIDDFFDLVVYGHEHESTVVKDRLLILQPGSTVRTSWCGMEGGDKYVYILNIGDSPVLEHVRLRTVRPLLLGDVRIEDQESGEERIQMKIEEMIEGMKKNDSECRGEINRTLIDTDGRRFKCNPVGVVDRVDAAERTRRESFHKTMMHNPLVRLRVEVSGDVLVNKHRIGALFKDTVANPNEMLSISRKTRREEGIRSYRVQEKIEISQILGTILKDVDFGALNETRFSEGLRDFIFKGEKNAFVKMVRSNVREIVSKVDHLSVVHGNVSEAIRKASRREDEEENEKEDGGRDREKERDVRQPYIQRFLEFNKLHVHKDTDPTICQKEQDSKDGTNKKMKKEEDSSTEISFSFSKYL